MTTRAPFGANKVNICFGFSLPSQTATQAERRQFYRSWGHHRRGNLWMLQWSNAVQGSNLFHNFHTTSILTSRLTQVVASWQAKEFTRTKRSAKVWGCPQSSVLSMMIPIGLYCLQRLQNIFSDIYSRVLSSTRPYQALCAQCSESCQLCQYKADISAQHKWPGR